MSERGIVVVGGGIAGVSAVAALRAGGYEGTLVLVDPAPLPYDRPPLSKEYLSGARDLTQICLQPREWYDDKRVELLAEATVTAVRPDVETVTVQLADGRTQQAGRVVLATGGRAVVPRVPGIGDVRSSGRLHVLREATDADRLRSALAPGSRLLVLGAGLIGAETASTALSLGCTVVLVDPADPPLQAAGEAVATWLHAEHARHGIDARRTSVDRFELARNAVVARLADGDAVEVDAVLVGVGMAPAVDLAVAAGLDVDRGILVDGNQVTSHPRVLAIGDAAQVRGGRPSEHWEAAQHDGQRAAATLLDQPAPAVTAGWWWSDRHGVHVEGVGRMHPADEEHTVVLRGTIGDPPFSAFTLRKGQVVGAVAVNDPHAVRAARRLIDRRIVVAADQIADSATDLRKLLRG